MATFKFTHNDLVMKANLSAGLTPDFHIATIDLLIVDPTPGKLAIEKSYPKPSCGFSRSKNESVKIKVPDGEITLTKEDWAQACLSQPEFRKEVGQPINFKAIFGVLGVAAALVGLFMVARPDLEPPPQTKTELRESLADDAREKKTDGTAILVKPQLVCESTNADDLVTIVGRELGMKEQQRLVKSLIEEHGSFSESKWQDLRKAAHCDP